MSVVYLPWNHKILLFRCSPRWRCAIEPVSPTVILSRRTSSSTAVSSSKWLTSGCPPSWRWDHRQGCRVKTTPSVKITHSCPFRCWRKAISCPSPSLNLLGIGQDENGICYTECGTKSYMAPEVLAKTPYDGALADLWSAGVVLFIMLAGNPPFQTAVSTDWWFKAVSSGRYDRFWAAHLRGCPDFPPLAQVNPRSWCITVVFRENK